ncbi:MAG TPA: phosphoglycerate kinase [Candidatus Veblenbacteria bacterium]|nr:phosphoglycerate kinase [Candidatus Veblenbacteria bacterium]
MQLKSIFQAKNLKGKTVLVRIDTNVPLKGKHVLDDSRLRLAVPTIRFLQRHGAYIILIGHLGRPAGKVVPSLSLKPVGYTLGKILRQPVKVLTLSSKPEVIKNESKKGLVLVENIRFDKGEDNNSQLLARSLARLGQIYVNEAFSFSHRATASMVSLPKKLPSYAGLALINEINSLENISHKGKKPVVAVIGGAKISDKLPVIEKLLPRLSAVLVGGGVANTLLRAKGLKIGKSLIDNKEIKDGKKLIKRAGKKLILPVDVVVDNVSTKRLEARLKMVNKLMTSDKIVDLGTETCRVYAKYIKKAKTIFWGGPLGLVEESKWRHATLALGRLASARARRQVFVVVGGGDTVGFFHQHNLVVDFFSAGGSAMLNFLAGEEMPGLTSIGYRRPK